MKWLNNKILLVIILIISLLATVWSLYFWMYWDPIANIVSWNLFNSMNGFPPCNLCWYMRVFQYPILFISIFALLYKEFRWSKIYILVLSILWLIVSLYKRALEESRIMDSWVCDPNGLSCATKYVDYLWFITLPLLWVIACVITIICCSLIKKTNE